MSHKPLNTSESNRLSSTSDFQTQMTQLRGETDGVPRRRQFRRRNQLRWLTAVNVAGVATLWFVIWQVSEQWWLGSVLTFLPRTPWLVPGLLLMLLGALLRSKTFWINLATCLFVFVSIVGFNIPTQKIALLTTTEEPAVGASERTLRVVSANVQHFEPDFALLLREIRTAKPDVIALQEASRPPKSLSDQFPDWHVVKVRSFWIGSKWPVKLIGQCHSEVYDRVTAIMVEVDAPFGKFLVTDLHLMTARKSLVYLKPKAVLTGTGTKHVTAALVERDEETRETRAFVSERSRDLPVIVCGDFNMPTSSNIYRTYFGDLTNAFEQTSWGCGYTAPCRAIRYWPSNVPWQRIDHILANQRWQVVESHVGQRDGSDHRLIAATLCWQDVDRASSKPANLPVDLSDEIEQLRAGR